MKQERSVLPVQQSTPRIEFETQGLSIVHHCLLDSVFRLRWLGLLGCRRLRFLGSSNGYD